jgi:hypothetical protein
VNATATAATIAKFLPAPLLIAFALRMSCRSGSFRARGAAVRNIPRTSWPVAGC